MQNAVHIMGNLTRDIELVYTQAGTAIGNMGVAVNNRTKRGEEWVDEPCFVDVTVFGKRAEWLANNLGKGTLVAVDGKLTMDQWEDRNTGQKRSKLKVIAQNVHLTGKRPAAGGQSGYSEPVSQGSSFASQVADTFGGAVESDLPF